MKAAIIADSGPSVGLGHVGRCMALAQALEVIHGIKAVFVGLDEASRAWVERRGFSTTKKSRGTLDFLVVDSYNLLPSDLKSLRRSTAELLIIEDAFSRGSACDWLLNSTIYAHSLSYAGAQACGFLLGPKFQPLREEFWHRPPLREAKRMENVLVSLGGGRVDSILARVLPLIKKTLPNVHTHIVVGPHSKTPGLWPKATVHRSPADFGRLIAACDIAISGGGQMLYELAFFGTPTVAVEISANQTPNIMGFKKAGAILNVGRADSARFPVSLCRAMSALARDVALRSGMANSARSLVDGQGALRVIRALSLGAGKEKRHD